MRCWLFFVPLIECTTADHPWRRGFFSLFCWRFLHPIFRCFLPRVDHGTGLYAPPPPTMLNAAGSIVLFHGLAIGPLWRHFLLLTPLYHPTRSAP